MRVVVLGATGATGRLLVRHAVERGLDVVAVARDPGRVTAPVRAVAGDVHDPASIARAAEGAEVLLSGLGVTRDSPPGTLAAGARAAVGSGVARVVWLGAYGTGRSAPAAGALTRAVLRLALRSEIADKVAADEVVLGAGGTVFHAGPLTGRTSAQGWRTRTLAAAPRRLFPAGVSRATVAAAMVDEAVRAEHPGRIVVPSES